MDREPSRFERLLVVEISESVGEGGARGGKTALVGVAREECGESDMIAMRKREVKVLKTDKLVRLRSGKWNRVAAKIAYKGRWVRIQPQ